MAVAVGINRARVSVASIVVASGKDGPATCLVSLLASQNTHAWVQRLILLIRGCSGVRSPSYCCVRSFSCFVLTLLGINFASLTNKIGAT